MGNPKEYLAFINGKWKNIPVANYRPCSNVVQLWSSFNVSIVLLWLSYRALKWILCIFEDGSKFMQKCVILINICSLARETCYRVDTAPLLIKDPN